jgi:hypothetical protein
MRLRQCDACARAPAVLRSIAFSSPLENRVPIGDALFIRSVTSDNGDLSGSVTDPNAHVLRLRYEELFGGEALPVPIESIAEDLFVLTPRLPSAGVADAIDARLDVSASAAAWTSFNLALIEEKPE